MNVLSLFDGISCAQIALERAGFKVDKYFASEIEKNSIKVTQHNYPNTIQLGNVTKVKASDLPQIDLFVGGSPCQGFSSSGKGLNFDDSRSKLFFEYVRLLNECKPKYFLLENVRMKKEWQDVISKYVDVEPVLINSNLLSAQFRQRLYWTNIQGVEQPQDKELVVRDIIEIKDEKEFQYIDNWDSQSRKYSPNVVYFDWRIPMDCSQYRLASYLDGKGTCVTCMGNTHFLLDDKRIRRATMIEEERLQTIPDNYTANICKTGRHKAIGNCFTVDVIVHILKNMKIDKQQLIIDIESAEQFTVQDFDDIIL